MENLTAQQRRDIIVNAHKLVWCTKVDFNDPDVFHTIDMMDKAGCALYQLGPLSRQELEEARIIKDNNFVIM